MAALSKQGAVDVERRVADRIDGREVGAANGIATLGERTNEKFLGLGIVEAAGLDRRTEHVGLQRHQLASRPELVVRPRVEKRLVRQAGFP